MILTRNEAIERLHEVLVTPATTTVRGIATEVQLDEDDGMRAPCALSIDNTFLANKALLIEPMTTLSPERMSEVCQALAAATGC